MVLNDAHSLGHVCDPDGYRPIREGVSGQAVSIRCESTGVERKPERTGQGASSKSMVKDNWVYFDVVARERPTTSQGIVTATFCQAATFAVLQEAARRHHCPVGPMAARLTEPILRGLI
jgi:hypothetical protein